MKSEEVNALNDMLIRHWLTVRGFSHTGAFLEMYKKSFR